MNTDLAGTAGSLLPLFVAVPLLLAGVSAVTRSRVLDRVLSIGVPLTSLAGAVWLLTLHATTPVIASAIGTMPMAEAKAIRASNTAGSVSSVPITSAVLNFQMLLAKCSARNRSGRPV